MAIIAFIGIICVFVLGVSLMGAENSSRIAKNLENAIDRCITECYALEGTYPPSLSYMEEYYGLVYDKNTFFVDYSMVGTNLRPDVTIIEKQGGGQ